MNHRTPLLIPLLLVLGAAFAQDHHHHHNHGDHAAHTAEPVDRPTVFLDKSPRIVWYQLNRLSNERLLLVERSADDPKFALVYEAILTRAGLSRQHRDEALAGLVAIHASAPVAELLRVLGTLEIKESGQQRVARQLAEMLLARPAEELQSHAAALQAAAAAENATLRAAAYAGLIVAGRADPAWQLARRSPEGWLDYLAAVALVPSGEARSGQREHVVASAAADNPVNVRQAAIAALAHVPAEPAANFRLVAGFVREAPLQAESIRTLLSIPAEHRDPAVASELLDFLVAHAESLPAERRTENDFIDAMQLADQLLALVPVDVARAHRERLRAVTVRVVRIRTVNEEMRYDTAYFAVEAGRSVQIVLQNEDLMPHNLVITSPGALQEVAELGAAVGPQGGHEGKQYVPHSDKVLHATHMVDVGRQERLTFTAPEQPGEYPYVCTFPRHWMRMYGVMVVVPDLDAWLQNPTVPADPIGNTREFVQSWTVEDFRSELPAGLAGRSREIGERIFKEATCAQCHKIHGTGGAVGPDLAEVLKRWKGDHTAVLREILDPSHQIDPKYAVQIAVLADGRTVSGIVQAEDARSISLIANPEDPRPTVVQKSEIDETIRSDKSMMPKALLDRFTKDEILELLAYVTGAVPRSE